MEFEIDTVNQDLICTKIKSNCNNEPKYQKYIAPFENAGYCYCCDQKTTFKASQTWYRDHYLCTSCGCLPRERAIMYIIETIYPNWRELIIHESSPGNRGASLKLSSICTNYIPSQFFKDKELGKTIGKYRNENLAKQTFESESFDLVITQDVLEHVYNAEQVFSEIERTLKFGGAHIFTVPFINKEKPTQKTAELDQDGNEVFLVPPVYHGNPIDNNGSLVTYHWGYDMIDLILRSSNMVSTIYHIDNLDLGIRAEYIEVVVSRKIANDA